VAALAKYPDALAAVSDALRSVEAPVGKPLALGHASASLFFSSMRSRRRPTR
jgi:hypothetical protein